MAEKTVVLSVIDTRGPVAKTLIADWTTPDENATAARRRRSQAKRTFLTGRALLRVLLRRETGQWNWHVAADRRGKIHAIEGGAGSEPGRSRPAISLSHSGDMVACALATTDALGIDIERHRSRNWTALAGYAFGEGERRLVSEGGGTAFFRIWTLREAWAKATGDGLSAVTDGRDKVADGLATGLWWKQIDGADWLLGHYRVQNDLSLSIAAVLPPGADPREWSVHWFDADSAQHAPGGSIAYDRNCMSR